MLLAQEEHYSAVMVFPEVSCHQFFLIQKQPVWQQKQESRTYNKKKKKKEAFWVKPYLSIAGPTGGSEHGTCWVLLLTGEKGPAVLLLLQQTHTLVYALSRK